MVETEGLHVLQVGPLNLNLHGRFTYTQETFLDLAEKGLRIKEIPVKVVYFAERKSRVAGNLFKMNQWSGFLAAHCLNRAL